jgi:hypothetical protein
MAKGTKSGRQRVNLALQAMLAKAGFTAWTTKQPKWYILGLAILLCHRVNPAKPRDIWDLADIQLSALLRRLRHKINAGQLCNTERLYVRGQSLPTKQVGPCGCTCCCQSPADPPITWIDDPTLPGPYRLEWDRYYAARSERWQCWTARNRKPPASLGPGYPVTDLTTTTGQNMTPHVLHNCVPGVNAGCPGYKRTATQGLTTSDDAADQFNTTDVMRRCSTKRGGPVRKLRECGHACQRSAAAVAGEVSCRQAEGASMPASAAAQGQADKGGAGGLDFGAGGSSIVPPTLPLSENGNVANFWDFIP